MPNAVKYKSGNLTGSLQKGNVALGVSGSLGPTSTTGWYNGPNPPVSGLYQIFETAVSGDPEVYSPQNDAELIKFARWKGATGADTGSAAAVLAWIGTQTNLMAANIQYENIVTDRLVFNTDAGFVGSYPTINTTWYDLSGNSNNGTLINGPTFSSANSGSIILDGVDDIINFGNINLSSTNKVSVSFWCKILSYPEIPGGGKVIFEVTINFNSYQTGFLVSYADDSNPSFLGQYPLLLALKGDAGYTIPAFNKNLVNDLQWHHYVCIFDKSQASANDECQLYLDGILRTPIFYPSGLMSNNTNNFGNDPLFIGGRTGPVAPSNIQLSNFFMYDRVLTQAEVTQNYNAQKGRFGL